MLGRLREFFEPWKVRAATPLARAGIHPNVVSVMALPCIAYAAYLCLQGHFFKSALVATAASLFDFIDGEVARQQNLESPFGNYLETMVDRLVETLLLLSLMNYSAFYAAGALSLAFLVSYAKARVGLVIITDNRDWPGVGDHSDRMVLIIGAILFGAWPWLSRAFLLTMIGLCSVGLVQRLLYARKLVDEAVSEGRLLPYLEAEGLELERGPST